MQLQLEAPRAHQKSHATPGTRTTAILVCHGMGQQVPFETISGIAHSILKKVPSPGAVTVGRVQLDDQITTRSEISFTHSDAAGVKTGHSVHIYEAYWAPLTEGRISLNAVLMFLVSAGCRGVVTCFKGHTFQRWKFGRFQDCTIEESTGPALFGALALIVSLLLLYGAFLFSAPSFLSAVFSIKTGDFDRTGFHVALFLSPFSIWPFAAFGIPLMRLSSHRLTSQTRAVWTLLAYLGLILIVILTILGGVLSAHAFAVWSNRFAAEPWQWQADFQAFAVEHFAWYWHSVFWAGAAALFFAIRYFLVEFVGDVTIYTSSYKVSEFDAIKKAIQKIGRDMALLIYRAGTLTPGTPYDRILVVGHSLGSVVAYDTINDMIVRGALDARLDVSRRTTALITFGSPLDKTAFLFRTQVQGSDGKPDDVREALAASVQPLIADLAMRPNPPGGFQWINIYSPADIVSGSLEYYNDAASSTPLVANVTDPQANFPLAAHIQYWGNDKLAETLYEQITR